VPAIFALRLDSAIKTCFKVRVKPWAKAVAVQEILPWRDLYRQEMNCQIVHDSLHGRQGWTEEYFLCVDATTLGYGSIAVGGPWKGKPTVFEFYVLPDQRSRVFDLFSALLTTSGAIGIEVQTNDPLLTVMFHTFTQDPKTESILFHDKITTALAPRGAVFRRTAPNDVLFPHGHEPEGDWVVEVDGRIAATGGILFHYNRPYGDIYMEVAEEFRGRGLGSYLVQELKGVCYEGGSVPAARCGASNVASRKTLQKAGFVPCGNILSGVLRGKR
jgi:GNAT superfamily N-acetyltransferase